MASGFSRLQLAAALLEYDNDPENPEAPHRSAHESAIFAHLRRNAGARVPTAAPSGEHLNPSLPSEGTGIGQRRSIANTMRSRTSRGSIDALRNPFGVDDHLESEDEVEGDALEVDLDLTSWGLDAFMQKDKPPRNGKGKAKTIDFEPPHSVSSVPAHQPLTNNDVIKTSPRRPLGAPRSMSAGGDLEYFGIEKATVERQFTHTTDDRRRSIGSPLDLAGIEIPDVAIQRRRASSHTLVQTPTPQFVPFPTTSIHAPSPSHEHGTRSTVQTDIISHSHEHVLSSVSADPRMSLRGEPSVMDRGRKISTPAMTNMIPTDDNPFVLRPPSRASRFDPKVAAHVRTASNASLGSRFPLDGDRMSVVTGPVQTDRDHRRSTTLDLLRPKVLVMPSPLQPPAPPMSLPSDTIRDGFQLSTDGPPLPPGARSARRTSVTLSTIQPTPPNPSNSFTPNPLITLSLSQLTFRNTLPIGDQITSGHMDGNLPRATEDGDQARFEAPELEESYPPVIGDPDDSKTGRPAGKLYGKSLIDDLENRKAQMRSKQRVFTGDQRPSMMARGSQHRTSTLIDPSALQTRPTSQHMDSYGPQGFQQGLARRNSANVKPLLNFDQEDKYSSLPYKHSHVPNSRSVFGVDTLWEREMEKLKQIESRERLEEEARTKQEREKELKKGKGKKKRKNKANNELHSALSEGRVSAEPPTLPNIDRAPRRAPPQADDGDSESDSSLDTGPSGAQAPQENWYAGSSDEDKDDMALRHATSVRPKLPIKHLPHTIVNGDSDDDMPLAATINRTVQKSRDLELQNGQSDDDDERPLSTLLPKKQLNLPISKEREDEDDQPLGLRVSKVEPLPAGDDDDRPLAYHPDQQRRTQYQMMAQQQMIMQAQMQNNMFFTPPSLIGSPYFGPSMVPMMIQPPMQVPSPPPVHDEAKYGRVDRWRRDVAIEGDM